MPRLIWFCLAMVILWSVNGWSSTPLCQKLIGEKKEMVLKLLDNLHPYRCCDKTINRCLKVKKPCKLAVRLADFICRLAKEGYQAKYITRAVNKRGLSMMSQPKKYLFDLKSIKPFGQIDAPVQLVMYACTRCPFCRILTVNIMDEIEKGKLKGKVKLYFRIFPLSSHPHSVEGGLALLAAAEQNKFWPYVRYLYVMYDQFSLNQLKNWAKEVGLDEKRFSNIYKQKKSRKNLVQSKKEGIRNGVKSTPTLFINGRKYHGKMDVETIVDILEEEYEAMSTK